jgi:hypothetical protein
MFNLLAGATSHSSNPIEVLIVLVVITALNLLKSRSTKPAALLTYPFQRRKYLLSAAEVHRDSFHSSIAARWEWCGQWRVEMEFRHEGN